ncbi:RagB/SusD family nutrient uptake outer membrane protein [Saccharicrinis aurantiacus]|uniref:RagB/SusD family nutrient uptake outer membrane protein n=1 Tax=Saccharicrinis aurantiacus TaxID=1849719 RepID=UPI0024903395|nr:RagB/SusD family nutrient uptake outer membrane protein [Saccharicrinis aurantiacus]
MKITKAIKQLAIAILIVVSMVACHDNLNVHPENTVLDSQVDYTTTEQMEGLLVGAYAEFQYRWEGWVWKDWSVYLLTTLRGDDVEKGAKGDQKPLGDTDSLKYSNTFWMYNDVWERLYTKVYAVENALDHFNIYKEYGTGLDVVDQYIAEVNVLKAYSLYQLTQVWGDILIPESNAVYDLVDTKLTQREDVLKYISELMAVSIPNLPDLHPVDRSDLRGGVTKHTAYAIKAKVDLDLKDFDAVVESTNEIIKSGWFQLEEDYRNLFLLQGKLNKENLFEMQYFANGNDDASPVMQFEAFGPNNWEPARAGVTWGWGYYEPTTKFIKHMIDREDSVRLEASVLFTNAGINEIRKDPNYAVIPDYISSTTRYGDKIIDNARSKFNSGKHYLPSVQIPDGNTKYGAGKNLIIIRYAEVLLMHAEAITQGASSTEMSALEAINLVRKRAKIDPLLSVTLNDVLDEKYAELAMEWGIRYADMVRYKKYDELSYDGREFSDDKLYLPYPQKQMDLLNGLQ